MSFDKKSGQRFGQERPPLYISIKQILERYPDGQIFKEMIQNADDAGAKTVWFYVDERQHGTSNLPHPDLARFQGPALVAANDACFKEEDWRGIQKLQQSIKAEDPFKVGRFGIGFNSVYHITDLPILISGEDIGILEPQEELWPGDTGRLYSLKEQQRSSIISAVDSIANFDKYSPYYRHTIFRLPLRSAPSKLSKNVYTVDKVKKLLGALKKEAKYLLLFLKSVTKIEVIYINELSKHKQTFCVSVNQDNLKRINFERSNLLKQLHSIHTASLCQVSRIIPSKATFKVTVTELGQSDTSEWVIVTQVGSENREVLQTAQELHIFPWVGVAVEVSAAKADNGRVFCFLPLPSEVTSGLPVHVNGTFSLNDERRTLKWVSAERTNDKMAKWNYLLVTQLLPDCYHQLLMLVRDRYSHEQFYQCWPDQSSLNRNWYGILENLYRMLFAVDCVWSTTTRRWVKIMDATFVREGEDVSSVVVRVLTRCGVIVIQAPDIVWKAFKLFGLQSTVNTVTPTLTREKIRMNQCAYESEPNQDKLKLLQYCLSDGIYSNLHNIYLVPLANGTFIAFTPASRNPVYVCSKEFPRSLVPNQDKLLVDVSDASLQDNLISVAKSQLTQLRVLDATEIARLLPNSFPPHWRGKRSVSLPSHGFPTEWFKTFWKWVESHNLSLFTGLPILPVATKSIRDSFVVTILEQAHKSSVLVVPENYPAELLSALEKLKVICTMTRHTPFVRHKELYQYVNNLYMDQILTAIGNASAIATEVRFSETEAKYLQSLLNSSSLSSNFSLSQQQQKTLEALSIFKILNSRELFCVSRARSTSFDGQVMLEPNGFQIASASLPEKLVIFSRQENCVPLFKFSRVDELTTVELIQSKVFPMIKAGHVSNSKLTPLMQQILQLLPVLKMQVSNIRNFTVAISQLLFLPTLSGQRKAPTELFDPSNKLLQDLFQGEDVFPQSPFNDRTYIAPLRECGLQTTVSAQQLFRVLASISQNPVNTPVKVSEQAFKRVETVMRYISSSSNVLSEFVWYGESRSRLDQCIRTVASQRSCLPVLNQPPSIYPQSLSWKGVANTPQLAALLPNVVCCTSVTLSEVSCLVGSEAYIVQIPRALSSVLSAPLNVSMVLSHFKRVLAVSKQVGAEKVDKHFKSLIYQMYTFLNDNLNQCQNLSREYNTLLSNEEWIWLPRKNRFVKPQLLALSEHSNFSETQLEPYLYVLPYELQQFSALFQNFGVNQEFSAAQIVSVLSTMRRSTSQTVSPRKQWSVVIGILDWITDDGKSSASSKLPPSSTLYVPVATEHDSPTPVLEHVNEVVYTDHRFLRFFCKADYKFIHEKVSHLAGALGAKGLSKELNISQDAFGDVGPHESLITRLKNILKDYQDGLTIIKELLQNADDAEATEVNICYDARSHQTDPNTLIFRGMAKCHGPALVVHNNGVFSNDDFKNIEKLAGATKIGQHLKIGKFGLGFCSVYHLTDIPSFVSRDQMYIFDPTLDYLKEENQDQSKPGKRLCITDKIVCHSKQMDPYLGLFGFKGGMPYNGTMFRFPFRTQSSDLSRIKYGRYEIHQLISGVKKAGSKLLLFLQHVNHITFSQIEEGKNEPTILLDIRKEKLRQIVSTGDSLSASTQSVNLFSIGITENNQKVQEKWLVATYASTTVQTKKYGIASVACSIQKKGTEKPIPIEGEMFCFLPLSIKTGLPVHTSSNFAVKNDRSGIHASDEQRRSNEANWNIALMESVIPRAYCSLLLGVQWLCENRVISANDYQFTSLWLLKQDLRIKNPWIRMVEPTYKLIMASKLFYSTNKQKWLMFKEIRVLSQSILCLAHMHSLPECVVKVMESLDYNLVSVLQVYLESLPTKDTSYIVSEEEFLGIFFSNFNELHVSVEIRNEVLHLLLLKFAETMKFSGNGDNQYLQKYLTKYRCIPCQPNGMKVKHCSEIVDPKASFATLYNEDDDVFPIADNDVALVALRRLGMISSLLPWKMIVERAKSIEPLYKKNKGIALERIKVLLQCIDENVGNSTGQLPLEASELAGVSFLPVMRAPNSYPDFLFWQGKGKTLLRCQDALCGENNHRLAGSQQAIICEEWPSKGGCGLIPYKVHSALCIGASPTLSTVIKHLCYVSNKYAKLKTEEKMRKVQEWINESAPEIFKFLEAKLEKEAFQSSDLKKLQEEKCIWTGKEFVLLKHVAIKWNVNGPLLFKLPDVLRSKVKLIKALKIQERFTVKQLTTALLELHGLHGVTPMEDTEMEFIEGIVSELDHLVPDSGLEGHTCYLPDEQRVLRGVNTLVYNDAQWCPIESECFVVHYSIARTVAIKLGVKLVRAKALEGYESSEQHFEGVEFGQHEELTQRINNILNEYPFDITVIKELLQNADDAKAKKLYFILDKRTHNHQKLPCDDWKDLQGPAVLVWNDKGFSEDDLKGIQKLGLGSKRSKSESIGQYGIGFNVVYHLTDCPSFITNGDTLCVLDPHMRYVPGATERRPGRMYDNLDSSFWANYSDLKAPYLRDNLHDCPTEVVASGSLFRFPLRHKVELVQKSKLLDEDSKKSSHGYPLLSASVMERHLDDWAPKMKNALIFLNNVVDLKFFVIETNDRVNLKFYFKAELDQEALSKRYDIQQKANTFTVDSAKTPTSDLYSLSLSEEAPNQQSEKWLVKRGIGDSMKPVQHWEFLKHIRPNHGLATPVGRRDFQGNVFCFLPLPMLSCLPVHVNGSFILDAARSGLWRSRDLKVTDDKGRWNNRLIQALGSSYSDFVITCQRFFVENSYLVAKRLFEDRDLYFGTFPKWHSEGSYSQSEESCDDSTDMHSEDVMKKLAMLTYKKLFKKNAKMHLVISKKVSGNEDSRLVLNTSWHPLKNDSDPSKQVYFWDHRENKKLTQILKRIGIHLSVTPIWIRIHFHHVGHDLPEATPQTVFEYYKQFFPQVSHRGNLPCFIEKSSFISVEDFKVFSEYILDDKEHAMKFPEKPWSLPLLVTADNQLRPFIEKTKVIRTAKNYSIIFKDSLHFFVHPLLLNIKYDKSYFLEPSKNNWNIIQKILFSAIPRTLHKVHIVKKVVKEYSMHDIKLLWDCLTSEEVFGLHLVEILKEWALLVTTDRQSFSCSSSDQLLPMIPPQKTLMGTSSHAGDWTGRLASDVYKILSKHGMPTLDTEVCNIEQCMKFCPKFSDPKAILSNMYHWYKLFGCGTFYTKAVLAFCVKKLFMYLTKIHYKDDKNSLAQVKTLPLFEDISGCYKSLEKEACIWPSVACLVGSGKWLNEVTTVFLPHDGDWSQLAPAQVLHIASISPLQLYTRFIFPSFEKFSQDERIEHLKHVRDTQQLFNTAFVLSESKHLNSEDKMDASVFVAALKQLPCLPINGILKPLHEFCDPKSKVFKLFPDDIHFPPEDLQDEEWLAFFRNIGMRTDPSRKEFCSYCTKVAGGKHKEILTASRVLLEYICFKEEWHNEEQFLRKVSTIAFVCVNQVQRLAWIKKPCQATNIVQQGRKKFHLTELRGSVIATPRNMKTVWTVRCLVDLPRLSTTTLSRRREVEEANSFVNSIGVSLEPSCECVVENLLKISQTDFASFGLFHKYQDSLKAKKRDISLVEVIHEHFLYLRKNDASSALLDKLKDVPCIPVSQEGKVTDIAKPVLVKPMGVVATHPDDLRQFNPYLNPLPADFFDVATYLFSIGVQSQVHLEQVQFALSTIHEQIQAPYDPNTIAVLQELIKLLYALLPHKTTRKELQNLKHPLHLPNKQGVLVDTKTLLFDDLQLFRNAPIDLSEVNYSFLFLLTKHENELNEYGFTLEDLHLKLPDNVQPHSLSMCSIRRIHEECRQNTDEEEQSEFVKKLNKAFMFPQFVEVVSMVLNHQRVNAADSEPFLTQLDLFLKHLQVCTVKDLKVNLSLSLVSPPVKIGTVLPDFHLQKDKEGPGHTLYVAEGVTPLKLGLLDKMSKCVSKYVLEKSSSTLTDTDQIIYTLMCAESAEQIHEYLVDLRINTSNLELEDLGEEFHLPKVGERVPESWHEWLQCDMNYYFRPQEMAALEVEEEQYIYVIVEHKLLSTSVVTQGAEETESEEDKPFELDKYLIRLSESENDTKIVTVVELHKLLCIKITQNDDSTEIVVYDKESENVKFWETIKGSKLEDIMKDICSDLRRIWKIQDKDQKRKAIKALYLKWHPDKNPHPLATKAFQFLQQQLARLEQGLPLEDPSESWEQDTKYDIPRTYDFKFWEDIIHQRRRTWQQEQRRHRSRGRRHGRRGGGGGGGCSFSQVVGAWTERVIVHPDTNKAMPWFVQAEYDQKVMKLLLEKVSSTDDPEPKFSAHVCYFSCQVAEKAIRAGMYYVCGLRSEECTTYHRSVGYAGAIEQVRASQAAGLQAFARRVWDYHDNSRYPSAFLPHTAPSTSDYFTPSKAREAEMAASQIMNIIRKIIFE